MQIYRNSEIGQAMIFLVLSVVVFLGFVGLAIDGGMVLSDRRNAQNAGDAASLAGGGEIALYLENAQVNYSNWDCANDYHIAYAMSMGRDTAIKNAASNGFFNLLDGDLSTHYGVSTTCGEENYGYKDRFIDVTVEISTTTETSFAQLLFPTGALESQIVAVTRVRPSITLAFGHAILALNEALCWGNQNGAVFGGSSEVTINGGGVWSNGCLRGNGNKYGVTVVNGSVNYAGEQSGTMNFTPIEAHVPNSISPAAHQIFPPDCSAPGAHHITNDDDLLDEDLEGLYCVNTDIDLNIHDSLWSDPDGNGVTIYVYPGNDVTITGGDIYLEAPNQYPDSTPAIPGVLFYVADGDIEIAGNNDAHYLGLIYAPNGDVSLNGTSGAHPTFNTQIIGQNVYVGGHTNIDINFDASLQYQKPSSIELFK